MWCLRYLKFSCAVQYVLFVRLLFDLILNRFMHLATTSQQTTSVHIQWMAWYDNEKALVSRINMSPTTYWSYCRINTPYHPILSEPAKLATRPTPVAFKIAVEPVDKPPTTGPTGVLKFWVKKDENQPSWAEFAELLRMFTGGIPSCDRLGISSTFLCSNMANK